MPAEVAEPRRAVYEMDNEQVDEAPMQIVAPPKQPEREEWELEDDVKESSNYSEDDGWGATEDLFEADHVKKAKEAAPISVVTT